MKYIIPLFAAAALCLAHARALGAVWVPDHVVIVVEENRSDNQVYGSSAFPYFNNLANNLTGVSAAKFTDYGGITHPSEPNYIAMFSGQTFGISTDNVYPFSTFANASNLGAKLIASGRSFISYSESMPSVGYQGASSGEYARKHNAAANWQDSSIAAANQIPAASNRPMFGAGNWPSDFSTLPTVSIVAPNLLDDGHDTSDTTADTWLQTNIQPYAAWAQTHNSLLVVTWDEDEGTGRIATVFAGQMVQPGVYSQATNHYGLERTIEDMYGLTHDTANTQGATTLTGVFVAPDPTAISLMGMLMPLALRRRRRPTPSGDNGPRANRKPGQP